MKDLYYILGAETNATQFEIREAYRKLSKKFHPDLNGNDFYFESRFKEIREAYDTLNDPAKRGRYDAALKTYNSNAVGTQKVSRHRKAARGIDITFSLVLITLVGILGAYIYRAIYAPKKAKELMASTIAVSSVHKATHHKKKHKAKLVADPQVVIAKIATKPQPAAIINIKPQTPPVMVKVAVAKTQTVKVEKDTTATHLAKLNPAPVNIVKRDNKLPVSTVSKTASAPDAYIKANLTGIVYLRSADNYTSDVIQAIPDRSKVAVLEKGVTFYKISFGNRTGYVPKWTVQSQ